MIKYLKIILSIVLVITVLVLFKLFIYNNWHTIYRSTHSNKAFIEHFMKINIPESAKVDKFSTQDNNSSFDAKLIIPIEKNDEFRNEIIKRLGKPQDKIEIEDIPNFVNVSDWWDMNNNDIDLEFHAIRDKYLNEGLSHLVACVDTWVFIMKPKDGNIVVYISY